MIVCLGRVVRVSSFFLLLFWGGVWVFSFFGGVGL